MIETIILAFIIAKIRGYKIIYIFKSWEVYPIIAFEIVYLVLETMIFKENYSFVKYTSILKSLYLCTFLILIFRYKLYKSAIVGSILIFIGSIFNNIAISTNNGRMPVYPTLSYITGYMNKNSFMKADDIHILGNSITKVKILTDFIDLGYNVISIGDIFIRLFAFIIIYNSIKYTNKNILLFIGRNKNYAKIENYRNIFKGHT